MRTPSRRRRTVARLLCALGAATVSWGGAGAGTLSKPVGFRELPVGMAFPELRLTALDGTERAVLAPGEVNVVVFVRPRQRRSRKLLASLPEQIQTLGGRVSWRVIASGSESREAVRAATKGLPAAVVVLQDPGDRLRGKLGVVTHPVVGIIGPDGALITVLRYRSVYYEQRIAQWVVNAQGFPNDREVAAAPNAQERTQEQVRARRHANMARLLFEQGQLKHSLDAANRALQLDGAQPLALGMRALALAKLARCKEALAAVAAARRVAPGSE